MPVATKQARVAAGVVASAISGVIWAGVAHAMIPRGAGIGPPISLALIASPLIGVLVGQSVMPRTRILTRDLRCRIGRR
jgi:hypothetical protein